MEEHALWSEIEQIRDKATGCLGVACAIDQANEIGGVLEGAMAGLILLMTQLKEDLDSLTESTTAEARQRKKEGKAA